MLRNPRNFAKTIKEIMLVANSPRRICKNYSVMLVFNVETCPPQKEKRVLWRSVLSVNLWLSGNMEGEKGTSGSYVLEHGPYAEQITIGSLDAALRNGNRNLPGGSSIPALNAQISEEHGLDYKNRLEKPQPQDDAFHYSL